MLVVLDTHAWIWSVDRPQTLGRAAARALGKATRVGVPAISPWEVAMKVRLGKMRLDRDIGTWVENALQRDARVEVLAISPTISVSAGTLEWDHGDPADRLIVATARAHGAPLITSDETIHESGLVRCVWD